MANPEPLHLLNNQKYQFNFQRNSGYGVITISGSGTNWSPNSPNITNQNVSCDPSQPNCLVNTTIYTDSTRTAEWDANDVFVKGIGENSFGHIYQVNTGNNEVVVTYTPC